MTEAELRERLRGLPAPAVEGAEDRAWRAVRDGFAEREVRSRQGRTRWIPARAAIPTVCALLIGAAVALAATRPPHVTLGRWLSQAIGLTAQPRPRPLLAGLPGAGQLLVQAPAGVWIVEADGTRRFLGAYDAAAWSPHTLYVVAWRGSQLTVLDPRGARQWSLTATAPITVARWSPDGYRIVYVSGRSLAVVAGDGSGAHLLPGAVAAVAPAWQPHAGTAHRLAVVDPRGAVQLRDGDTGAVAWTVRPPAAPHRLLWSPDGRRLLVLGAHRVGLYDDHGRLLATATLPAGETVIGAAFAPAADRVALSTLRPGAVSAAVSMLTATVGGLRRAPRTLFAAASRIDGLSWSPDGRWLLASVPASDQWIFIATGSPSRLAAVGNIAADFRTGAAVAAGFPALGGWQQRAAPR